MSILITRSSMPDYEEYCEEIKSLWESHWLTNMGEKHNTLEKMLKDYMNVKNISLFVNGHISLENAIAALNLSGEVITTPFTFASTTQAIVRNNLTPVFCDINEDDFTMDASKIESLITEKTSAIVPVHVYGNICDVRKISEIAEKYNLKVIYDAAHAFGEEIDRVGIGNFGDMSMFSFHATKVYNTIEGGCITYSDNKYEDILKYYRNFGMKSEDDIPYISGNSKMNEFQAAMGICNLRHVDDEILKRKKVVKRYQQNLGNIDGLKIWSEQKNVKHNYAYFPVLIDPEKFRMSRDDLVLHLSENDIYARKYFYPITSLFKCYKNKFAIQSTPIAKRISDNILTLPLYADLELSDVDRICETILN